jgi:hypothetical protein
MGQTKTLKASDRTLNARPDTLDFRDLTYEATLVEVPSKIGLDTYEKVGVPILDQGQEGACTGFGLATVVHYLLRKRAVVPDSAQVSPRMLYEMAKRHDEWPGEEYSGSSARGAMKGWHKYGVCEEDLWPYVFNKVDRVLTDKRAQAAARRPLGAYFRVNHKNLVAMHAALAEVGILYATSMVHEGWNDVGSDGQVPFSESKLGGHAFAIVAYDQDGFWFQNSWGPTWGLRGFGHLSYDDWLQNGTDVWVARLGVPISLKKPEGVAAALPGQSMQNESYTYRSLRPHLVSLGNDGALKPGGLYGSTPESLNELFQTDFPRITQNWKKKRILLYAHGGLVSEGNAVQRVSEYLPALLEHEVYPIAFIWRSDYWSTIKNIVEDAFRRRKPEGILGAAKDFMLDRLDDALEPLARMLTGKASWDEMKENALGATTSESGGARLALGHLDTLLKNDPSIEVHVAGHSAGSIFHGPLLQLLSTKGKITAGDMKGESGLGHQVETCTLWAPACTTALFKSDYLPLITAGQIKAFTLFTLTDCAEQDDNCAGVYHKSLLYLVSNAFEEKARIPLFRDGIPILGMETFVRHDQELSRLFGRKADWILSPNNAPEGSAKHSTAAHHGDFDDDVPTVRATLARILGATKNTSAMTFGRSESSRRDRRGAMSQQALRPF